MSDSAQELLLAMFEHAIAAVHPMLIMDAHLPADRQRPLRVIGAGKAAGAMAAAVEMHWQGPVRGHVVTRYDHACDTQHIMVMEAAHPVPDDRGLAFAKHCLAGMGSEQDEFCICLLSGGGSSLLSLPADGISPEEKRAINKALLRCGAPIGDMNTVRKHLSAIKGGRLALAANGKPLLTLAISDVPGDDPSVIASGPTIGDDTTAADALAILKRYDIGVSDAVVQHLQSPAAETPDPDDPRLANCEFRIIAKAVDALRGAEEEAERWGYPVLNLGDDLEGESKELAKQHADLVKQILAGTGPIQAPCVLLSGGETSVTLSGDETNIGRGGRNAEYLLAFICEMKGEARVAAFAADTDGIDGSEDNAGAFYDPEHWQRALDLGIDPQALLEKHDAYRFFEALDSLHITGPTRTNVNDFRAIFIADQ